MQSDRQEPYPYAATALPADPAWDEAFLRVESYLRAHQLESRVRLNHHASTILQEAAERVLAFPWEEPVEAAMHVTRARIGEWFARAGNWGPWSNARVRAEGRLALVLADFPPQWADTFLAPEPLPHPLTASLAGNAFEPGPELSLRTMPTAELVFGLRRPAGALQLASRVWRSLREAAAWLSLLGLFGVAWVVLH